MSLFSFIRRKVVNGCRAYNEHEQPLMTRYHLYEGRFGQLVLHVFHRSDLREMHDHPWPFWSLILWGGYIEESRPSVDYGTMPQPLCARAFALPVVQRTVRPGMLLFRPARHMHRIVLRQRLVRLWNGENTGYLEVRPQMAITLVYMRPPARAWGFLTALGWQPSDAYAEERGCE